MVRVKVRVKVKVMVKVMTWAEYKRHIEEAIGYLDAVNTAVDEDQIEFYFHKAETHIDKAVKAWKDGLK